MLCTGSLWHVCVCTCVRACVRVLLGVGSDCNYIFSRCYRYNMKDSNQSVLLLGDTGGGVTVLEFSKASQGLFLSQDSSKQGEARPRPHPSPPTAKVV